MQKTYGVGRYLENYPPNTTIYRFITEKNIDDREKLENNEDIMSKLICHLHFDFWSAMIVREDFSRRLSLPYARGVFVFGGPVVEAVAETEAIISFAHILDNFVGDLSREQDEKRSTPIDHDYFFKKVINLSLAEYINEFIRISSKVDRTTSSLANQEYGEVKAGKARIILKVQVLLRNKDNWNVLF